MKKINPSTAVQRQAGKTQAAVISLGSSLTIMGAVMVAPVLPKIGAELGPLSARADALVPHFRWYQ